MLDEETGAAETAGNQDANDEYAVTSAQSMAPPPPETFPDALAEARERVSDDVTDDVTDDGSTEEGSPEPSAATPEPSAATPEPAGGTEDGFVSVEEANRDQLELAVDERKLTVQGTGTDGYVTDADLRAALKHAGVTQVETVE